jgi:hypothetical protein
VVVYAASGQPLWSTATESDRGTALCTGGSLRQTQFVTPIDGQTPGAKLELQHTCNLVLTDWFGALWASTTDVTQAGQHANSLSKKHLATYQGCHVVMQGDGNLVMYGANGTPMWASGSTQASSPPQLVKNFGPYTLVVVPGGTKGYLVQVRTVNDVVIWSKPKVVLGTPATATAVSSGVQGLVSTLVFVLGILLAP